MIAASMPTAWTPSSWQHKQAVQQPTYADADALRRALDELAGMPPLVTSWEIESLKQQLGEAAQGKRFLLQGGDCCETFDDCRADAITSKLKILLQMSLVLVHGTHKPVIRVGRFAGQYAKPRSGDSEQRGPEACGLGLEATTAQASGLRPQASLPVYRGDLVNRIEFTSEAREPDPRNLLRAYSRAALTLNFIRALIDGGFADLHHPEYWDLGFVQHSPRAAEYQRIVEEIGQSLRFMETLAGQTVAEMSRVNFYTSHEGLHLSYEQAQTRRVPRREGWYNLGCHFPWIGMRTADADGAHVEYFRGLRNPIAVKVGPDTSTAQIARLVEILNPDNESGRLTIVHRFGARDIARLLPATIESVRKTGRPPHSVLWVCDPMHGNTQSIEVAGKPVKTRAFEHILVELEQAFEIHAAHGSHLGGVHFELTGENVTECTGGARNVSEADLSRAYKSQVDPRLNYEQSLEMAMRIAKRAR